MCMTAEEIKPKADDGWIKHDGGPCPIPWAKVGEFEAKRFDGMTYGKGINASAIQSWETMHIAKETQIIAYRLTGGWIPIVGGKCPQAIGFQAGTWEIKSSYGDIIKGGHDIVNDYWTGFAVAIRRIKQPDESILETRDHKEPGISRAAKSTKFIPDLFEQRMASFEAKRTTRKRKNPVPEIGMREMLAIAGKAMED